MLEDNIDASGNLNTDKFVSALLQYRNTPDRDCLLSPAKILFGRPLRDSVPQLSSSSIFENTLFHSHWHQAWAVKEEAMRSRLVRTCEKLNAHTKDLKKLEVGDEVFIQNQNTSSPACRKWDRQGTIIDVRDFNQHLVRVTGSGRVTLRNRKFLRKIKERSQQIVSQLPLHGCLPTPSFSSSKPAQGDTSPPVDQTEAPTQHVDDNLPIEEDSPNSGEEEVSDSSQNARENPLMLRNLVSHNNPGASEQLVSYEHPVRDEGGEVRCQDEVRKSSCLRSKRKLYDASTGTYN